LLPSDFDGTVPPQPGEPDFYMELSSETTMNLYKFHVDFDSPPKSAFSGPTKIAAQRYRGCTTNPPQWGGVPQPPPGAPLDRLADRLMYRLAWRNLNGVEHLIANHSVMPPSGNAGAAVRWYDITGPSGSPLVADHGTFYDPSTSYWMASIAMDKLGDISLGFSASSTTVDPSIYYTGRVPTDP